MLGFFFCWLCWLLFCLNCFGAGELVNRWSHATYDCSPWTKNVPLSALYRISVKERLVPQYSMFKDNNAFSSAALQLHLWFLWSLISWNRAFMQKSFSDICSVMYCSRLTDDTLRHIRHRKQRRQENGEEKGRCRLKRSLGLVKKLC